MVLPYTDSKTGIRIAVWPRLLERCTRFFRMMAQIRSKDLLEAEELLAEIASWPDDRIERLPKLYQEKAHEYRRLANSGER